MHFDARAEVYETYRPPYPDSLWDRLRDLGVLRHGIRVLELGAGTGEATGRLVDGGARVTAVEPGPALAARLRRRVPGARVLEATAEDVDLPYAAFDLAVAATAVHWFDLEVVVPKLHHVLRPGGRLAVWRTVFGDPEADTPFRKRVAEIVAARGGPPKPVDVTSDTWTRELTASGHFTARHREAFRWSIVLDTDQVRGLFSTFSDWDADEVESAAQAATDLGGLVTEHYVTLLVLLDRQDPQPG
jgi:SAM-dependent methyltransferase